MDKCAFCGRDPFEYVDNGIGMDRVAVTCCELGCAVYDHRNAPENDATVTIGDLQDIASRVSSLQWQIERRDRLIAKLSARCERRLRRPQ